MSAGKPPPSDSSPALLTALCSNPRQRNAATSRPPGTDSLHSLRQHEKSGIAWPEKWGGSVSVIYEGSNKIRKEAVRGYGR